MEVKHKNLDSSTELIKYIYGGQSSPLDHQCHEKWCSKRMIIGVLALALICTLNFVESYSLYLKSKKSKWFIVTPHVHKFLRVIRSVYLQVRFAVTGRVGSQSISFSSFCVICSDMLPWANGDNFLHRRAFNGLSLVTETVPL